MRRPAAYLTIVILAVSISSLTPSRASMLLADKTVTVTTILRVETTIELNSSFAFQTQGTLTVPVLLVNARLVATGEGLNGVIAGQLLIISASWGQTLSCRTNLEGVCYLRFSVPPLGGANTLTAYYNGNSYFASCVVTRVV